jgi:hypothetical protein
MATNSFPGVKSVFYSLILTGPFVLRNSLPFPGQFPKRRNRKTNRIMGRVQAICLILELQGILDRRKFSPSRMLESNALPGKGSSMSRD